MTHAAIENKQLVLTLQGFSKVLAFKNSLTIPIKNIKSVAINTKPLMPYHDAAFGLGTIFAGKIQAGTFKQGGKKSFWDVRDPNNAVLITLKNHTYEYVVLDVADSKQTIKDIKAALK